MSAKPNEAFDFDAWANLAQSDPEAFEARRRAAIDDFIASVPAHRRRRLHGLQCRLDLERRRAKTPLGACVRFHKLMMEQVEREFLPALRRLDGRMDRRLPPRVEPPRATVIPLRPRRPRD